MRRVFTALLLCCPLPGLAQGAFEPRSAEGEALRPAVEWALGQAPRDWMRIRLTYAYRDAFAKVRLQVMGPHTRRWRSVPSEDDPLIYAFFDDLVARQAPQAPWSALTVTVDRETRQYAVTYCRAAPDPADAGTGIGIRGC